MQALSFEQAPPPSVPLRFFLTAPLFLLLGGLLLLVDGEAVMASRWTPAALGLTHLMTAGFMLQVMLGALFQLMPVAAGANLWRPRALAIPVHLLSALGAVVLVAAFHHQIAWAYQAGVVAIGGSVLVFFPAGMLALWRTPASSHSLTAFRIALLAFFLTVLVGGTMALARAGVLDAQWLRLSSSHVALGLAGWGCVLVAAVGYLVVPMFQLTPAYPRWFARSFAPAIALAIGVGMWVSHPAAWLPLVALIALFAGVTLDRQLRRRRAKLDATFRFWRFAMGCVLLACVGTALVIFSVGGNALPLAVGVLAILGGFVSVISGMLYKIVPFILWLYLQPRVKGVPPMTRMLNERWVLWHWRVHVAMVGAGVLATLWWPAVYLAGGLMVVSAILLGGQLLRVVGHARQALRLAQPS
ncbi:hypothetical protein [Denitromonas ohlonensis]|jgi:hypothetical protein|uniref:Uncharacterized protein n=2 Tax=Denitromonas TaxID=139331 RepID=A0A557SMD1_9RHOO|nr:hypothetical protein [Denitromonas ohlonensis]TVT46448.1 MAG: hypothetical protein FHP94_16880 [Denitromonas halophila]TVO60418.1 hypothetical protein FHP90_18350 [Denitromonas ohlonensis]TVO78583.1 hypothetical protein FHP89_05175 [Denitromonas ohlonensis]TVT66208.1 MAG: hypothetical protein FHP93_19315 [Denitromonas halophila]TVT75554.1 MAG: hypothetical protein FHP92_11395 [Denitromonas halophila]